MDNMTIKGVAETPRGLSEYFSPSRRHECACGRFKKCPAVITFSDITTIEINAGIRSHELVPLASYTLPVPCVYMCIPEVDPAGGSVGFKQDAVKHRTSLKRSIQSGLQLVTI